MEKTKYKRVFDSISAPENAERRVLEAISPRRRTIARKVVLALCAVLILTCGAAFATGTASQWLDAILSLNGRQLPEGNLQKIGRTSEGDGLRITLDSVAGDGVHTYFLFDVEALDGQNLSNTDPETIPMEDSLLIDCELQLSGSGGYSLRAIRLDAGSDPTRAQFILKIDMGVPRNGSRLTLTIDGVHRGLWTTGENGKQIYSSEPVAEGAWAFSIRLNGSLDGVHYTIPEYDFDISISPLGMAINGIGSRRFGGDAHLLMQDGSKVELTGRGYSSGSRNGITYRELVSYEFTGLIDAERAAALVCGGIEYPLVPLR